MKKLLMITLAAVGSLSIGSAMAQIVSGGDAYNQGYAAGAAPQKQNSFSTFDNGVQVGQTQQSTTDQAYTNGYQAGITQGSTDKNQVYTNGYNDGAVQENNMLNRSFDNGFRAGAGARADLDADFP